MEFIGIDFGTTYSCVSKCDEHGMTRVIASAATSSGNATPSVVYYDEEGKPIVGELAKGWTAVRGKADRTLSFIKRSMGQEYCPTPVVVGPNNSVEKRNVSPVEGCACVLHALFQAAVASARTNGEDIPKKAVITIPAGYTNKQRSCTKKAAELAGIDVEYLIHEPTAAAISHNIKSGECVLVFDLGGGTLDVSVVSNDKGAYKTLAVKGDIDVLGKNIGGKDWDEKLKQFACQKKQYKASDRSEEGSLMLNAEKCKISLTQLKKANFVFPDNDSVEITRAEFETNTRNLVKECIKVVEECIKTAEVNNKSFSINRFIMVGGSSNMPMLRRALSTEFGGRFGNGREDSQWIVVSNNSELSISEGAALFGYLHSKNPNIMDVVSDKSTKSYGTSAKERATNKDVILNLISSKDPIVMDSKEFTFSTTRNDQDQVVVDIYENSSDEDVIPFDNEAKPIYRQNYNFNKKVQKETEVKFIVSRDLNGIIKIIVSSAEGPTKVYEASTLQPPITPEVEREIKKSIALMDQE